MHRVETERSSGVVLITARGELDAFAAPDLARALGEVAAGERVVVDLHAVSFLDSTALGVVVQTLREIEERRDVSRIVLPKGPARRIFELTTLDQVLPVEPSRDRALAALTPSA
jgi:anti-sigma B factor antagonist